jgi:hypothetical protein
MFKKFSRRGQGHVEMIISFVLFVGFLVFVFAIFNPLFRTEKSISADNEKTVIVKNISDSVGKLAVVVASSDDCYSVNEIKKFYGSNFVEIIDVPPTPTSQGKYTLYFGDFFDPSLVGKVSCSEAKGNAYSLGAYTDQSLIIKQKAISLKQLYDANYKAVASELGIINFAFAFRNLDGTPLDGMSVTPSIPQSVDIASLDSPVVVIDDKAKIEEFIMNVRTW